MANGNEGEDLALENEDLKLKREDLRLKWSELQFKKDEAAALHRLEKWKTWGSVVSVFVAALALATPVSIALLNVRAEQIRSEEEAKRTFRMKSADLAFTNARNATQAKQRALSLAELFHDNELRNFAEHFEPERFKLDPGRSIENRQQVINLLTQYPDQRKQILKDWYVLFWWEQWWVEPILEISADEKKQLDELSNWLRRNEESLKKGEEEILRK